MTDRRSLIAGGSLAGAAPLVGGTASLLGRSEAADATDVFPDEMPAEAWRDRLSPERFAVLREEATEPAFSSPLHDLVEPGRYHCAGCANLAYSSAHKYDSGTGWPSFWRPVSTAAIGTRLDYPLLLNLTEVHCARCGGHFGHIFDDGPEPTGLRHCINGLALRFRPGLA